MHRHKTFVQFLVKKLLELYCPDSNGNTVYSKRFCRDELAYNISEKLNIDIILIPGDEVLFDFVNYGICSEATEEKMANLFYQGVDIEHRPELLKDYLHFAKRKQVTAKPCFNRFVQQFFGEPRKESNLPPNLRSWVNKLTDKDAMQLRKILEKRVERIEGKGGEGKHPTKQKIRRKRKENLIDIKNIKTSLRE